MELNKIYFGDTLELLDNIDDNSIDLVITSPPYADTIFYGDEVENKTLLEYPEWFAEIGKKIKRVLKPSCSFILILTSLSPLNIRLNILKFFSYKILSVGYDLTLRIVLSNIFLTYSENNCLILSLNSNSS